MTKTERAVAKRILAPAPDVDLGAVATLPSAEKLDALLRRCGYELVEVTQ